MLVLSRRVDEKILIGDDITILIIGFRDGKVRLGIQCPKEIRVDREEVRERINHEQREPLA